VTIRVLVVDDQTLVRTGFRMILDHEPDIEVVGEAADGLEALDAAARLEPDVILMDVRMPNMDGIEATRHLTDPTRNQPHKVIILTTFDLDEYVFNALGAGASGFLLKDAPTDDLVRAVRVVASGDALVDPAVTRRLIEAFVVATGNGGGAPVARRRDDAALAQLTEREVEVLQALARGLSNAEVAADLYVSETTVKTHVGHILTKLGLRDRVQAVVFAYEHGLVQPGPA